MIGEDADQSADRTTFHGFRAPRRALALNAAHAIDTGMSTTMAEANERREGRFERHEMRRQYCRLSRLVGTA